MAQKNMLSFLQNLSGVEAIALLFAAVAGYFGLKNRTLQRMLATALSQKTKSEMDLAVARKREDLQRAKKERKDAEDDYRNSPRD